MRLILASASPRRAELLKAAGYTFDVAPADVDETPQDGEAPELYTGRVALDKARHVSRLNPSKDVAVLAADTEVFSDGRVLGKPADGRDAARMLRLLSGQAHEVITAVVVILGGVERTSVDRTIVRFTAMTDADIEWYVASGEPLGKAGGYAIQGRGARFIDRIEGSWSTVVGLTVHTVHRLLDEVE
ncbi:MAG: Maf family protein [Acidobacteriota bacterium]|nr:Maf family protein [Acidobacteriota bacterium]